MSEDPAGAAAGHDGQPGGETPPGWGTQPGWETPWPESPATGTGRQERADLEVAFAAGLRRTGALMQLMGTAAADKIGINATDLNCLNILSFSGHMTAGELARATGLTTASITGVVDRLEEAGFVTRERDPHDRRRVVVQINLRPGHERRGHDLRPHAPVLAGDGGPVLRRRAPADRRLLRAHGAGVPRAPRPAARRPGGAEPSTRSATARPSADAGRPPAAGRGVPPRTAAATAAP